MTEIRWPLLLDEHEAEVESWDMPDALAVSSAEHVARDETFAESILVMMAGGICAVVLVVVAALLLIGT
jgi:hypothetical protein